MPSQLYNQGHYQKCHNRGNLGSNVVILCHREPGLLRGAGRAHDLFLQKQNMHDSVELSPGSCGYPSTIQSLVKVTQTLVSTDVAQSISTNSVPCGLLHSYTCRVTKKQDCSFPGCHHQCYWRLPTSPLCPNGTIHCSGPERSAPSSWSMVT